jgi:hypothetical protein
VGDGNALENTDENGLSDKEAISEAIGATPPVLCGTAALDPDLGRLESWLDRRLIAYVMDCVCISS